MEEEVVAPVADVSEVKVEAEEKVAERAAAKPETEGREEKVISIEDLACAEIFIPPQRGSRVDGNFFLSARKNDIM